MGFSATALFLDSGLPAPQLTEVVKFRTADLSPADHLDLINPWGVEGKCSLHPYPVGDFSDGEALAHTPAAAGDDRALEDLDPLLLPLNDTHVNLDGVAWGELRQIGADLLFFEEFQCIGHGFFSSSA